MWITLSLVTVVCFSTSQAGGFCENVLSECVESGASWTRCYEDRIATCRPRGRSMPGFKHLTVDSLQEANVSPTFQHRVHIPSSALQRSRGNVSEVLVVASVINSTYFKLSPPRRSRLGQFRRREGVVFRGSVLSVRAGNVILRDLPQPIKLIFSHDKEVENGTCVFWQESGTEDGTGYWSIEGCETTKTAEEFICSCNHLSFFAVLVNPQLSVSKSHAEELSYITYIGSALSIVFTFISLIIYICLHRRRPEKATRLHMQLTGAMLCLHLSFLLCCFWVWLLNENEDSSVCLVLGLFLHWSLLATFSWTALEGFHLYLLLSRVFNIDFRRYLLKLSLVGWGFPTLVAAICGISGVYGKYTLRLRDSKIPNTTAHICWMSSEFPQKHLLVSYITTVAFPSLVVLFNACIMGLVVFKLYGIRTGTGSIGNRVDWKKIKNDKGWNLWKDSVKVLGLSFVLGLPWGFSSTTYISLPGIYVFTIFNSLQGVFIFLWSVALTRRSHSDNNSSYNCHKKTTASLNSS
ncbi:adhesion G protein-coupled receptor G3-like [Archocentrus centrarchus]|uniref:adhesion G protein-coupled receptor G3-like n=1 Tax=Archocentrus centrarchus TaxID=63155 RepID=UPI0011E9E73A|nr:adhesion G protein-coupled receptor G3-like [Archocentrus centrarchus]